MKLLFSRETVWAEVAQYLSDIFAAKMPHAIRVLTRCENGDFRLSVYVRDTDFVRSQEMKKHLVCGE